MAVLGSDDFVRPERVIASIARVASRCAYLFTSGSAGLNVGRCVSVLDRRASLLSRGPVEVGVCRRLMPVGASAPSNRVSIGRHGCSVPGTS